MHRRNPSKRLLLAAVLLLLPLRSAAQDDLDLLEEPVEEVDAEDVFDGPTEPDWIPSVKIGVVVNSQFNDGTVEAVDIDNFTGAGGASFLKKGDTPIDGPAVAAGFEILGPPVLWGRSRPLLHAGLRDQLEGAAPVARDQTSGRTFARARLRLQLDQEQSRFWYAGLGAAVPLPIEDWDIKLKASLNYTGVTGDISGTITQPVLDGDISVPDFEVTETIGFTNHGIAPRLELDTEIYREGPISIGFFVELETVVLFGNLEDEIVVNSCHPNVQCTIVIDPVTGVGSSGQGIFTLERNKVIIQGGAGVRISWMGY